MSSNMTNLNGWIFKRVSAEYIDIFPPTLDGSPQESQAVANINVYDYAKGESSVPYTREALRAEAVRWMDENAADLHHYYPRRER